ncbi:MAG TPA: LuxR C-terminal-related transcriptional regulator [Candidatus Aquilonibacter sp.]
MAGQVDLVLERARIALANDPASAVDLLLGLREALRTDADRLYGEILLGSSFAELHEFETADAHFERARQLLDHRSFTRVASLAAARGRRYILELRIGDAWRCYEGTLVDRRIEGRIRSEHLKGAIHHAEARNSEHAASLMQVLALIGDEVDMHIALWYRTVADLGLVACEIPAPAAAATVAGALDKHPVWSAGFSTEHFYALRSLAWCKALSGDTLGAFRYLRDAGALAESLANAPLRAIILLDRAEFARNAGEEQWCANELAAAIDLLRDVDWPHTSGYERSVLPLFAEVLAPTDAQSAAAAIARHSALTNSRDPVVLAARGMVHLADGRTREGVRDLSSAYDAFERAGSAWRAGKVAIALAQATGIERWRLLALENLEFYASSWLYEQARTLAETELASEGMSLTPMQERVFNMICEGLSTEAIATRLGRSRSTVRNHVKLIFKAMGVNSRAALVAKAARDGRLP